MTNWWQRMNAPGLTPYERELENELARLRNRLLSTETDVEMLKRNVRQLQTENWTAQLNRMENTMSALDDKLDELAIKIGGISEAVPATVALLDGIHAEVVALRAEVAAAADIPAALARIDDFESTLASRTQELSEANIRNTDLAPAEPPAETPAPGEGAPV